MMTFAILRIIIKYLIKFHTHTQTQTHARTHTHELQKRKFMFVSHHYKYFNVTKKFYVL